MISIDKFQIIVENAPLIAIDFIVELKNKYLLGKRVNKPAAGYYFTPGGRIYKDEKILEAIKRVSKKELNVELNESELRFLGVFEHFYDESFVKEGISTHYIVLAYKVKFDKVPQLPTKEHNEYNYFTKEALMQNSYVHEHVKDYFRR